jgi:hypothetical protein
MAMNERNSLTLRAKESLRIGTRIAILMGYHSKGKKCLSS